MIPGRQTPRQDELIERRVDLILAGKVKPCQPLPKVTLPPVDICPKCGGKMVHFKQPGYFCLNCG